MKSWVMPTFVAIKPSFCAFDIVMLPGHTPLRAKRARVTSTRGQRTHADRQGRAG
ncbi:MAG: hypothetical protein IT382_02130 [Deltaproteobacteria bacterium]|nr:hypothetical protein [Deltaproteobacteria bacterium]